MAYILPYVWCVEATEYSLLSDSSDTKKLTVVWSSMFSYSITSLKIYSMRSTSVFYSFKSSSSLSIMSSMMVILGVHSNMGYWSKVVCFTFFASSSTLFTTSSSIGSSIHSSLWISFTLIKKWGKVLHLCFIPSILSHGCFYDSCCYLLLCI